MSYDVASFGLIYNHNVARNQWPQEVPSAIRSERYAVVKLTSEISLTVWSLPGDASLERGVPVLWSLPGDASVERDVPVLCGRAPYRNNGAFYSSWVVFRARVQFAQFLVLDMKEELALESLVGEACCQQLFSACRVCCEHVWQCFNKIDLAIKGENLYMILLASQHQTEFIYNCLSEGLKQHNGYSTALHSLLNPADSASNLFMDKRPPELKGLSVEQEQALVAISKVQQPLITMLSPPGAGKSFLNGKVLDWWRILRHEGASCQPLPLAVVATGVRSHRRHLRNEIAIDRELDMLIVDEVDDQTIPELASLLSHFNQAYLFGDWMPPNMLLSSSEIGQLPSVTLSQKIPDSKMSADDEAVPPLIEQQLDPAVAAVVASADTITEVPPGYMLDQDGVFCFRPHPGSATQLRAPDTDEVSDDSDGNIVPPSCPPLCDSSSENEVGGPVPANEEDSSEDSSGSDLVELISHLGYNASENPTPEFSPICRSSPWV
jgi:hypothetical protein